MKKLRSLIVFACVITSVNFTSADIIQGIDIDFVTVGNAGNTADTSGFGAVGYDYRISKYEITNTQWNTFTAASGAPAGSVSAAFTGAQQPTNNVSWYEAAQFCNYLTSGNKYSGAYQFDISGNFLSIDRVLSTSTYGTTYVIPTEDEWYKAAYHMNDGLTDNYWLFPTQSNASLSNDIINPDPGNNANFYQNGWTIGSPNYLTAVGDFENSDSAYGTFDQGGNVWEWNETFIGSNRGLRGGAYYNTDDILASSSRYIEDPHYEYFGIGFRIVSIPEPASATIMTLASLFIALKRRKQSAVCC